MADPRIPAVVLMWSSQLGKTEIINNFSGFRIDQEPGPMLNLQPTLEMAKAWSKDRLATMLRDTPRLRGKVKDARSRDSENTMLHKSFAGGHLTIVGANSPAGLAARPIRDLVQDEVDRYPASAGAEGDPSAIAESRQATFPNAKNIKVSSPTLKGSAIDKAFELSDQRWFWVPCPHCGHEQKLEFGGKDSTHGVKWDGGDPSTAHYVCIACSCVIEEYEKLKMLRLGRWIPENPGSKIAGFRLNAVYSPFFTWARLVERWIRDHKDQLKLRTFVNTMLCEPWDDTGEGVTRHVLESRIWKQWPAKDGLPLPDGGFTQILLVPMGAGILTRSVDVQGDRLETTVWAWGEAEEAWRLDFEILPGDPTKAGPWLELAKRIDKRYPHESGAMMGVSATFVDSGGHHSKQAYEFARGRVGKKVFAIKGSSLQQGVPLISKPHYLEEAKVVTFSVGSFTGKEALMSRLAKVDDGAGCIHLPPDIEDAHLDQFLNERLVTTFPKGRAIRAWHVSGPNEQVDLYVYALAALHSLGPKVFRNLGEMAKRVAASTKPPAPAPPQPSVMPVMRPRPRKGYADWK